MKPRYQSTAMTGLPPGAASARSQNALRASPDCIQAGSVILCSDASIHCQPSHTRAISHSQAILVFEKRKRAIGGSSMITFPFGSTLLTIFAMVGLLPSLPAAFPVAVALLRSVDRIGHQRLRGGYRG